MNKLVYSALALTLVSVPGFATENEWSSLDREIANLSASLAAQGSGGPKVGGYVRTSFRDSSDIQITDPVSGNDHDQSGFQLDNVRVEISGDAGSDYSYKVSFELKSGSAELKDAYAKWKIAEGVNGKMGNFKLAFFRSGTIPENRLLFLDRTFLGDVFATRDLGVEFAGNFDVVDWAIGGQNGSDLQGDEYKFYGKVSANLMGSGQGNLEGAYGAGEGTNLSFGIAACDDGNIGDGLIIGGEAYLTAGNFSLAGEIADFDTDVGDNTPFDATGSYLFTEMYEAAVRYEDADDVDNTTRISIAVNRYTQGHDIKWTVQYTTSDSDDPALEVDQIGLGLGVSF